MKSAILFRHHPFVLVGRASRHIAASQGHGFVVLLLDLTAAFDTIDHEILLDRISSHCGIDGKPLAWIASYLRNRTQSVIVDGAESDPVQVKYGVPQGSVVGPKLYTIK